MLSSLFSPTGRPSLVGFHPAYQGGWFRGSGKQHTVTAVNVREQHRHVLASGGGEVFAHIVGADGELPVPPVDQHRQLHRVGSAQVAEGVSGGADGTAGKQHVVDQDDIGAVDLVDGNVGFL